MYQAQLAFFASDPEPFDSSNESLISAYLYEVLPGDDRMGLS